MDGPARDGAAVRLPPPVVYLAAVAAGVAIHRMLPLTVPAPDALRAAIAVLAALAGAALIAGAVIQFRRTGQHPAPWKPTPEVVSCGVYRLSRNPMYLGLALLQAALGLGLDNGWIVILLAPAAYVLHRTVIRQEEAYLEAKFGDDFLRYKAAVRRWL